MKRLTRRISIGAGCSCMLTIALLCSSSTCVFQSTHTFVWNMSLGGAVHALVVCFAHDDEEANFKQFFNLSYLETGGAGMGPGKLEAGDQAWAIRASDAGEDEDQPMEDEMKYDEDEERVSTRDYPESTYGDEPSSSSSIRVGGSAGLAAAAAASSSSSSSDGRNDNLAVGQLLNRTFVNRGNQIGVFKHGDGGLLEYVRRQLRLASGSEGHSLWCLALLVQC